MPSGAVPLGLVTALKPRIVLREAPPRRLSFSRRCLPCAADSARSPRPSRTAGAMRRPIRALMGNTFPAQSAQLCSLGSDTLQLPRLQTKGSGALCPRGSAQPRGCCPTAPARRAQNGASRVPPAAEPPHRPVGARW